MWLIFTMFNFGKIDQFFAFLGVIGLIVNFVTFNSQRTLKILLLDIISFMLLASPLIRRLTAIPIENFNYLAFIIPTIIFGLFYIFSLYFSVRHYSSNQKVSVWHNKTAYNRESKGIFNPCSSQNRTWTARFIRLFKMHFSIDKRDIYSIEQKSRVEFGPQF